MKITLPNPNLFCRLIVIIVLFYSIQIQAQAFTDSNLPIVIINTDIDSNTNQPLEILDDPRILASMKIIKRPDGTRNYLTDQNTDLYLDYQGRISIEIRGSTSQFLSKKPYGFSTLEADNTTNDNVSLLGMPSENDWILNSLAFDPSLIRDYISYNLSSKMGNYASRTVYCEVVINAEYRGLYLLQEKIKANSKRVNILKITSTDNTTPNVTGGYITKSDKTTGNDPVAWAMSSYAGQTDFIHDLPKPEEVTGQQEAYIYTQFANLETTSHNNNTSITNGYPSIIDVPSFIDFMVINELASNVDAYQFSTYFHKDRNGKLRAGPIWDFNLTYGNDLGDLQFTRSRTDVWQFSNGDNEGAKFWTDLFNNPTYKCYLAKRWNALQQNNQPLEYTQLVALINNTVNLISEATVRENAKWGTIPNHALEINTMKLWIDQRLHWISTHLGSFSGCSSVVVPALVIDKINYHPDVAVGFPESNDLEFIEIKNTQNSTVNLTGIYFKELGITYKFPNNASISGNQSIYLASNSSQFQARYGLTAFGEFTRNLSNSTQKLVLADAFGNTIDAVEYFDAAPWPDADGNGNYLQLISTTLDNSLASSWIAANETTLSTSVFSTSSSVVVSPNPVSNILNVESAHQIDGVQIFDVLGHLMFRSNEKSTSLKIDFSGYSKGIYMLNIFDETGSITKKIIKQ
ncbi:CotH kinase family protein [Flavobacterium sp.]|uniref:CotH kinase family protein n=1 Tax=Flavobacterium sp. TaxID=239 RepID=UPI00286AB803|nr:CotH kinase family protein [Flavobacterium sp.]